MAVDKEEQKQAFVKEALMLKQAKSLCSSMLQKDVRLESEYFETIRVFLIRLIISSDHLQAMKKSHCRRSSP